jgi:squalene-hopene/tetraprenyl-beta-curcumene cyclase
MSAPLALIWSHRPVCEVGIERGVRELFIAHPSQWPAIPLEADSSVSQGVAIGARLATAAGATLSSIVGYCEQLGWTPVRRRALERAESVLLHNIQPSQIGQLDFRELVWHALALRVIGFSRDRDELHFCETRLEELARADDDSSHVCPRVRHTAKTDTISALESLGESGLAADHPCAVEGANWLRRLGKADRHRLSAIDLSRALHAMSHIAGDGSRGELIPTIQVAPRDERQSLRQPDRGSCHTHRLSELAACYLIGLQNPDGGWGVAGARQSAADVTGAVIEALARCGITILLPVAHREQKRSSDFAPMAVEKAVKFLRMSQRADGSWDSATGVRLVHGTSLGVRGLLAAGISRDDDAVSAGIHWLLAHQHASGGWGETVPFTTDVTCSEFTPGPATASQTAWALSALVAADQASTKAALRGVQFLLETQDEDGSWHDLPFVHRDAPARRWFRSELDSALAPLVALSRWGIVAAAANTASETKRAPLRLVGATSGD